MLFLKKSFHLATLALCLAQQVHAEDVFNPYADEPIGCGTITSVRDVDQTPIFNDDVSEHGRKGATVAELTDSSSNFGQLAGGGVLTKLAAGAGSLVYDAVANASAQTKVRDQAVPLSSKRYGKTVHAVRVLLDDGREVNLPLIEPVRSSWFGHDYAVGRRLYLAHSKQYGDSFKVIYPQDSKLPVKGDSDYEKQCASDVNGRWNLIVKNAEHMVDEIRIVE